MIGQLMPSPIEVERPHVPWVAYTIGGVGATIAIIALGFAVSMRPTATAPAPTVLAAPVALPAAAPRVAPAALANDAGTDPAHAPLD